MPTPKVDVKLERITVKRAKENLERNYIGQRNKKPTRIRAYATDMKAGRWQPYTGETVKFTENGDMLDGQNRMWAIIEAGIAVQMLVAYNVPEQAMPVIDTGVARTFADTLKMEGTPNPPLVGAVVRRVIQWENGNYIGLTGYGSSFATPTNSEKLERYQKEPDAFVAAAKRGADVSQAKMGQGGPAGTAFFLFSAIDHQMAHQYFDHFLSGADMPKKHPILSLRNRMIRMMKDERLSYRDQMALYCRAWNAYRTDDELERVLIKARSGLTNENFPIPK